MVDHDSTVVVANEMRVPPISFVIAAKDLEAHAESRSATRLGSQSPEPRSNECRSADPSVAIRPGRRDRRDERQRRTARVNCRGDQLPCRSGRTDRIASVPVVTSVASGGVDAPVSRGPLDEGRRKVHSCRQEHPLAVSGAHLFETAWRHAFLDSVRERTSGVTFDAPVALRAHLGYLWTLRWLPPVHLSIAVTRKHVFGPL